MQIKEINEINELIENSDNKIYLIVSNSSYTDKSHHKKLYSIFKQIINQLKKCDDQAIVTEFRNNILSLNKYDNEMVRIRLYRIILYILYLDLNGDNINNTFVQKILNVFINENKQYGGANSYNQNQIDILNNKLLSKLNRFKSILLSTKELLNNIYKLSDLSDKSLNVLLNFKIAIAYLLQQIGNTNNSIDLSKINERAVELDKLIKQALEIKGNVKALDEYMQSDTVYRSGMVDYLSEAVKIQTEKQLTSVSSYKGDGGAIKVQNDGAIKVQNGGNLTLDNQYYLIRILLDDDTSVTDDDINKLMNDTDLIIYLQNIITIFNIILRLKELIELNKTKINEIINTKQSSSALLFPNMQQMINFFFSFFEFLNKYNYNSSNLNFSKQTVLAKLSSFMNGFMLIIFTLKIDDTEVSINNKSDILGYYNHIFQVYTYDIINIIHYYNYFAFNRLSISALSNLENEYAKAKEIIESISLLLFKDITTFTNFNVEYPSIRKLIFNTLDTHIIDNLTKSIIDAPNDEMKDKLNDCLNEYTKITLINNFLPVYPINAPSFMVGGGNIVYSAIPDDIDNTPNKRKYIMFKLLMYLKQKTFKDAIYNKHSDIIISIINKMVNDSYKNLEDIKSIDGTTFDTPLNKENFSQKIADAEKLKSEEIISEIRRNIDGIAKNFESFQLYAKSIQPNILNMKLTSIGCSDDSKYLSFILKCVSFVPSYILFNILSTYKGKLSNEIKEIIKFLNKLITRQQIYETLCKVGVTSDKTSFVKNLSDAVSDLSNLANKKPTSQEKVEAMIDIMRAIEQLITQSLNAIKVFVKFRYESKENGKDLGDYVFDSKTKCIGIKKKSDTIPTFYGKFHNIFATESDSKDEQKSSKKFLTTSHLYCGSDDCSKTDEKIITGGVKDLIKQDFVCTTFETVGVSGAGKTALLFGIPTEENDGLRNGLVSRILTDVLKDIPIIGTQTEMKVNILFGEVYGEKMSYKLDDQKFMECLILWKLGHYKKSVDLDFIQNIKEDYYVLEDLEDIEEIDRKSHYSMITGIRKCYMKKTVNDVFSDDSKSNDFYNKCVQLNFQTSTQESDSELYFKNLYGIKQVGIVSDDKTKRSPIKTTTYDIFTSDDDEKDQYFLKYKEVISNLSDIRKKAGECSKMVDDVFKIVNVLRTKNNRVRCTKNNYESSRSQLFVIFVVYICGKKRYFVIFDKAGNEAVYEIAGTDLEQILKVSDDKSKRLEEQTKSKEKLLKSLMDKDFDEFTLDDMDNIDISRLISHVYLRDFFYGKINFNDPKPKENQNCNEQGFLEAYASLIDITTFLFNTDIKEQIFTKEALNIDELPKTPDSIFNFINNSSNTAEIKNMNSVYKKNITWYMLKKFIFYSNMAIVITFIQKKIEYKQIIITYLNYISRFFNINNELSEVYTKLLNYVNSMFDMNNEEEKCYEQLYTCVIQQINMVIFKLKLLCGIQLDKFTKKDFTDSKIFYSNGDVDVPTYKSILINVSSIDGFLKIVTNGTNIQYSYDSDGTIRHNEILKKVLFIINTVMLILNDPMKIDSHFDYIGQPSDDQKSKYGYFYHLVKYHKDLRSQGAQINTVLYIPFIVLISGDDLINIYGIENGHIIYKSAAEDITYFPKLDISTMDDKWTLNDKFVTQGGIHFISVDNDTLLELLESNFIATNITTHRPSFYTIAQYIHNILVTYTRLTGFKLFTSDKRLDDTKFKEDVAKFISEKYISDEHNRVTSFDQIPWEDILKHMLRDYLLNGLQGFLINDFNRHSIESNAMMTRKQLYDGFIKHFKKEETGVDAKIAPLFKLTELLPRSLSYDDKNLFTAEILKHALDPNSYTMSNQYDGSCQIYKITPYNVKDRIWLKLIWSIRHLGASCNIFDISRNISIPDDDASDLNIGDEIILNDTDSIKYLKYLKDYYTRYSYTKKATVSFSNVLLLAATTLERKVESVRMTLEAAQIIARLTGEDCSDTVDLDGGSYEKCSDSLDQKGGSYEDFNYLFKKSYHNYINGLNKNISKRHIQKTIK